MKKMYLTPLAEVVKMETETMICQSGFGGGTPGQGGIDEIPDGW